MPNGQGIIEIGFDVPKVEGQKDTIIGYLQEVAAEGKKLDGIKFSFGSVSGVEELKKANEELKNAIKELQAAQENQTRSSKENAAATIAEEKAKQAALKTDKEREKFKQEEIKTDQQAAKAKQEKIKIDQQEEKLSQQEIRTQQLRTAESVKAVSASQKQEKQIEKEAIAAEKLASEYKQLEARARVMTTIANEMGAKYGSTSQEFLTASERARVLNVELKAIDAGSDKFQRNVGNYANGITKAFGSAFGFIRQLAYILPGIGIAGILGGIIDVVVDLSKAMFSGTEALNTFAENYKNVTGLVASANVTAGKQIADLKILYAAAIDVNSSIDDRKKAVKALKEEFPDYFGKIDSEIILNGKAQKSYDDLSIAIIKSSRASAAKLKIDDIERQKLDVEFQRQKIKNATDNEKANAQAKIDANVQTDEFGNQIKLRGELQFVQTAIDQRRVKALRDQDLKEQSLNQQEKFLVAFAGEKEITKVVVDENTKRDKKGIKTIADAVAELRKDLVAIQGKQDLGELAPSEADINRVKAYDKAFEDIFKRGGKVNTPIVQQLAVELNPISVRVMERQIKELADSVKNKDIIDLTPPPLPDNLAQRNLIIKNTSDAVQRMVKLNNEGYVHDQQNLKDSLEYGFITEKEYNERAKKLEEQHQRDQLTLGINLNEALLENLKARSDGSKAANDQIAAYELELSKLQAQLSDLDVKRHKEANAEKDKADKEAAKKREDLHKAEAKLAEEVATLGISLFENNIEVQKNQLAYLQRIKEDNYSRDIAAIQSSSLSEQDKAAQTIQLQAKEQADRVKYDREQKDLDIKKAKFDKEIAVLKIAENTAVGIMAALSSTPPNIPLSIVIGAIGAVEAATVLAKPIPKYKDGVTGLQYSGLGIYGEAGPELIEKPGFKPFIADKATLDFLPRGTNITPIGKDEMDAVMYRAMTAQTAHALMAKENNGNRKMDELIAAVKSSEKRIGVHVSGNKNFSAWTAWADRNTNWD